MKFNIGRWFASIKNKIFTYKDGFFELPFVANSPELIVESFSHMPFMTNYPERKYFSTNNLFLSGDGHYQKIEEGLWIIISNIQLKKNVSFKLYYESDQPATYHYLTLFVSQNKKKVKLPKIQLDVDFQDRAWTLYKANSECLNTHFAGQHSIYFTIYFSQEWLHANLSSDGVLNHQKLTNFFESENEYMYLPNFLENKKYVYEKLIDSIIQKDPSATKNLLELKMMTYELMTSFVDALSKKNFTEVLPSVSERDKRLVMKAQYLLEEAIFDKFPTISKISRKLGVSETKIKADFKALSGKTMFQYYQQRQMIYALKLLRTEQIMVKEIAHTLGYSSPGKFSEAFKKYYGYLPTEMEADQ